MTAITAATEAVVLIVDERALRRLNGRRGQV
jgi:hypothetical protein